MLVVDPQLRITKWSRAASELWGLREDEVEGEHLLNLDIGVPVGDLREPIRTALTGADQSPIVLEGHNDVQVGDIIEAFVVQAKPR